DEEVARTLGRSVTGVAWRRKCLGIAKHKAPPPPWSKDEEILLGTKRDAEIARMIGRAKHSVSDRRRALGIRPFNSRRSRVWTSEEEALLGSMPDHELAQRLKRG